VTGAPTRRSYVAVLTPVSTGRVPALEAALDGLPTGGASPLAAVPGTHYGRWLVVNRLGPDMLLFSAVADLSPRDYLPLLYRHLGPVADRIWSHCTGWPGAGDAAVAWLEAHRIEPSLSFGTWQAGVEEIRAAVALRQRLRAFVLTHQGAKAPALHREFVEEFGP
jgi:hypothetical protein